MAGRRTARTRRAVSEETSAAWRSDPREGAGDGADCHEPQDVHAGAPHRDGGRRREEDVPPPRRLGDDDPARRCEERDRHRRHASLEREQELQIRASAAPPADRDRDHRRRQQHRGLGRQRAGDPGGLEADGRDVERVRAGAGLRDRDGRRELRVGQERQALDHEPVQIGGDRERATDLEERQEEDLAEQHRPGERAHLGPTPPPTRRQARPHAAGPTMTSAQASGMRRRPTSTKAAAPSATHTGTPSGLVRSDCASFRAVPAMSPADTAPIPRTAPAIAGLAAKRAYTVTSARTMPKGTVSSPPSAARAPRQPKKRSPSMRATLQTFGPWTTWPIESSSTNSARLNQRLSSQSTRCATTTTPPKPCSARSVNATNSSRGDPGRREPVASGAAGGRGGALIATRGWPSCGTMPGA